MTQAALGAYGLRIAGLAGAEEWMQPVPASFPRLRVENTRASGGPPRSRLDSDAVDLRLLGGGRLRMRRGEGRALFNFPQVPRHADLLHPYLAPAAALVHMWAGGEALHGGAFATPAGSVALLAEKAGGKSTTLACLADEHGVPVLSDDLVAITRDEVLCGPRCLDLRKRSSLRPIDARAARLARDRERARVSLPQAPSSAPLIGTAVLRWGHRNRLDVLPPADRVRELLPHRMYRDRLAGDPSAILKVASLPMVVLTRPRGRVSLSETAGALIDYFG